MVTRGCVVAAALVVVAGCSGASLPVSPTAPNVASTAGTPSAPLPAPGSPPPWAYGPQYVLAPSSLAGVVFEVTSAGAVPIPEASVYCDACGQLGHTWKATAPDGSYSFSGDIALGGGVWVRSDQAVYLVEKAGYKDPVGAGGRTPGWRDLTIRGDTRFDVQLMKR